MDDVTTERWLPVVGFEGFLEVSDQGRICSLDRVSEVSASKDGTRAAYSRSFRGRILKPQLDSDGYLYIALWGGGKVHNAAKVHHVVLDAFVGTRPDDMEGCHGNGDRADNRLTNLRWDTRLSNHADRVAAGNSKKTQCKHGHKFTPKNTKMVLHATQGHWYQRCRTCEKDWQQTSERRRRRA